MMAIGISIGWFFGGAVLRDMVGDVHRKMSHLLADRVTKILYDEIIQIKNYAHDPLWRGLSLQNISKDSAAARLKVLAKTDVFIARLSILDRYGGLVASSQIANNLTIADDRMLKIVLAAKGAGIFVGNIYFDEAVRTWVITAAVPMISQDGNITGVFRADIAAEKFFSLLNDFRIDSTGHAFIADEKGKIIFHPGKSMTNILFCDAGDYEKLLTSNNKYAVLYEPNLHKKKMFVTFSEVAPPVLLENGIVWRVFIDQEAKEAFAPLNRILLLGAALAVISLIIIMVLVSFIFGKVVIDPIQKLNAAALQIAGGNWNYLIDIKTNDEIEQFADVFKEMISTIKDSREKLEKFSKTLEEQVDNRTKELSLAKNEIGEYATELEKALLIKSDFISMASHELRTPLAAIKEGLSIVLEQKAGIINERQKEFLDIAKSNVDRLGRIIGEILDFQKIEQDNLSLKMEANDINDVIRDSTKTMMPVAKAKGLDITTELDETLPKINFDRDKITQVVTNLIDNAIKFTEKGSIAITTGRGSNVVVVSVRDSGIGIKVGDMPRLFQKFVQLGTGLERRPGGTGLGLAISYDIIKMHKGKIWAESKYRQGSAFYFILPIIEQRERSA